MSVNLFSDDSDKTSSSDAFDEPYEVSTKTKISQSGKKKKPKRNRSAFIIFSSEMRTKLRANDRDKLNSNEMMVKLAELWKNLAENEKKKYYSDAEKEKVRYHNELNNFYQSYPAEVIQNKTKKNHIKKPCSAYALYLKDMKQVIKNESPDLKMADILKVVAERWKKLDENQRMIFQRKAQTEKEIAKAKMNEAVNYQPEEVIIPKKASPSRKKASSPKKTHKPEDLTKVEETETKVEPEMRTEEPPIVKKQPIFNFPMGPMGVPSMQFPPLNFNFFFPPPTQTAMSHQNSAITECNQPRNDFSVPDFPLLSNPFSKLPSLEPMMMSKYSSKDEGRFGRESSQMWNFPQDNFISYKPNELDLMNFHSFRQEPVQEYVKKEDGFLESDDDDLPSTTNLTPTTSVPSTRHTFNNALISALEPRSDFEPLNLDAAIDSFIL